MREEEIIQTLENMIKSWNNIRDDCKNSELSKVIEHIEKENKAIQGLLDLYNKQKEEIKLIKELNLQDNRTLKMQGEVLEMYKNNFISKDKIRQYVNSPEFLDWHLGFTLLDELEYRKNNINELLED